MSILDGLRIDQSTYPGNMSHAHNCALDTVQEALRSDETVTALAGVLARDLDDEPYWSCVVIAKRIVATLAGGDDE